MKTHNLWPLRRFADLSRDAIDTRPVVTNGCDQQGRHRHAGCASCVGGKCTTAQACECPAGEEVESADGEVIPVLIAAFSILCVLLTLWATKP